LPPDVHLVSADGSRHGGHRLVLCAWSPVLTKELAVGKNEVPPAELHFPGVQPEHIEGLLSWMYGGPVRLGAAPASPAWLPLVELAQRWGVAEFSDQFRDMDAIVVDEANVVEVLELAQRLCLSELEGRCHEVLMSQVAAACRSGAPELTAPLQRLEPGQFLNLLRDDLLPVASEEMAFRFVVAYVAQRWPEMAGFDAEAADALYSAVRWRLVPAATIAGEAMTHATLREANSASVRAALLPALADGLQFHALGEAAARILPESIAGKPRVHHRLHSFSMLRLGLSVRVVEDVDELCRLCMERAPGADMDVGWKPLMRGFLGGVKTVTNLDDEAKAAELEKEWWFPFNALCLA